MSHPRAVLALLLPMVACAAAAPPADPSPAEPPATSPGPRVEALPALTPAEIEALGWLDADVVDIASGKSHAAASEALAAARSELLLCLRTDDTANKPKAWQVASADKSGALSLAAASTPEPPAAACLRQKLSSLKLPASPAGIAISVAIDSTARPAATTPQNEIGGLLGDGAGDAFGTSGLGLRGTGVGGGGIATGIGLGNTKPGTLGGGNPVAGGGVGGGGAPAGPPAKPKQPAIVVDKAAVRGSLDEAIVSRVVRQNLARFRGCYEKTLRANPALRGRIETTFTINPSGDVVTAKSSSADLSDAEMLACVQRSFIGIAFPKPTSGLVVVRFPIMFAPPGAAAPAPTNKAPELPAEPAPRAKTIAGRSFDKLDGASLTTKLGKASREVRLVPIANAPAIAFVREDSGEIAVVARVSGAVQSACAASDAGYSVVVQASDEPSCKALLRELLD